MSNEYSRNLYIKAKKSSQSSDGCWNILQALQKDNWENYVEFV